MGTTNDFIRGSNRTKMASREKSARCSFGITPKRRRTNPSEPRYENEEKKKKEIPLQYVGGKKRSAA
jgi:hypothetical protein